MADQYRQPYLDSTVFIAYIKGEVRGSVDRGRIASHILTSASNGLYRIYTSAFTIAEVHKKHKGIVLPSDLDERLLLFFEHDYIEIVGVDRVVGEEANRLARAHGLNAADAIHLASALRAGCDVFLHWDSDFDGIALPNLRIENPEILGQSRLDDVMPP